MTIDTLRQLVLAAMSDELKITGDKSVSVVKHEYGLDDWNVVVNGEIWFKAIPLMRAQATAYCLEHEIVPEWMTLP